ncbi:MAG: AMP-binding protein [Deltaproteobacteria bacterium]|nr:AMP-binding protein [Deltaproteobacteria bacterium]
MAELNRPIRYTQEMIEDYFAKGYWTDDTTSRLWTKNARLYPDREAFVSAERRLTWSQVKMMSDRVAWGLVEMGLKRGEMLLVLLGNCFESYLVRVACEKAGILCATALMTVRESEIEYILKNFGVTGIIIPRKFRNFDYCSAVKEIRTRTPELKHILLTGDEEVPGTVSFEKMMDPPLEKKYGSEDFSKTEITATEISVIAMTSGTTGAPKGVEHAQCARMAVAHCYRDQVGLSGDDVVLNIISGVAGLGAGFNYNGAAPLAGAKSVLLEIWEVEETLRLIEREKATVLVCVPAQLTQIVRAPSLKQFDLSSLRCVSVGTAPLPTSLAIEVEETMKIPVVNTYGQLDGGVVSYTAIDDIPEVRRLTVGKPARGMVIQFINEEGREDSSGEVVYSGPTTSGGYYKDVRSTLEAWKSLGLEGRFRSGDLGRLDASGNLLLMGRKKDVIIRGGQNIYPVEVEGLLLNHPKVKSVAIIPMPDPVMGEKPCAYVALNPGEHFTFEEMVVFLKEKKIALYKIPERLEVLEELPLRGYQKVAKIELQKDLHEKMKREGNL